MLQEIPPSFRRGWLFFDGLQKPLLLPPQGRRSSAQMVVLGKYAVEGGSLPISQNGSLYNASFDYTFTQFFDRVISKMPESKYLCLSCCYLSPRSLVLTELHLQTNLYNSFLKPPQSLPSFELLKTERTHFKFQHSKANGLPLRRDSSALYAMSS